MPIHPSQAHPKCLAFPLENKRSEASDRGKGRITWATLAEKKVEEREWQIILVNWSCPYTETQSHFLSSSKRKKPICYVLWPSLKLTGWENSKSSFSQSRGHIREERFAWKQLSLISKNYHSKTSDFFNNHLTWHFATVNVCVYIHIKIGKKIDYFFVLFAYIQLNTFCHAVVPWEPIHRHGFPEAKLAHGELSQRLPLASQ